MTTIVDKRKAGKNASAVNRSRFIERNKYRIKKAVHKAINDMSVSDTLDKKEISVPDKNLSEPHFRHGKSGSHDVIVPGNDIYEKGDRVRKPRGGGGRGSGGAGDSDDPLDDEFLFTLTKEEFIQYFFEDLELPDLVRKEMADMEAYKNKRAGYTNSGVPTNLHIIKSMKGALSRRIALGAKYTRQISDIQEEINALKADEDDKKEKLLDEMLEAEQARSGIPYLDTFDLRYRNNIKHPEPSNRAVMICLMDTSYSMGEEEKGMAKRFFILLYLFLTKVYAKIDIVFVRHTAEAEEVTEQQFFYGRESGGTKVSAGLELVNKIIEERYPASGWNVYVAQASDGDNYSGDNEVCSKIMSENILPKVQYFAYIEIIRARTQELWDAYEKLSEKHSNMSQKSVMEVSDIYPVFRDLFKKRD